MRTKSRKMLNVLTAAVLVLAIFAGCTTGGQTSGQSAAVSSQPSAVIPDTSTITEESASSQMLATSSPKTTVRVGVLKGPTGMGMVGLMDQFDQGKTKNDYTFTIVATPEEMLAKVLNNEVDVAAVPTNMAAVLYQKTDKKVDVLAAHTLGVLYILTKDEKITSIAELAGKTVYATGQNASPEYVLNYILAKNNIKDVKVEYQAEHAALASLLLAGKAPISMLPQPFVTTVTMQDPTAEVAIDLTSEWKKVADGVELVMGAMIARSEFLDKNKEAVDFFLEEYKASTDFVNGDISAASVLIGKYEILPQPVAEKAIKGCNIVCITGDEMKSDIEGYLKILYDADPKSVGGSLPDEGFYYKK